MYNFLSDLLIVSSAIVCIIYSWWYNVTQRVRFW
jgi:hypothetical protein